jgi:iron only hydrogenase large subunit-like protein
MHCAESATPETDSVLATTELHDFLQSHGADLTSLPATPLDSPFTNAVAGARGRFYGAPGSSGGYLEHVFRTAALELFGQELPAGRVALTAGRNPDIKECSLQVGGRRALRFAAAYGFRNIQGLMRKVKAGKCEYDYVEVMACPSGCLNGGGQLKPAAPGESAHQLIERLEQLYHGDSLLPRPPQANHSVQELYREWVGAAPYSARAQQLFHTQYHAREKSVTMTIGDW